MKEFSISSKEAGQRMDKYLFKILNQASKGFVYKMLRKKNIVLNDKKATGQEVLQTSDQIKIYLSDETFNKFASALAEAQWENRLQIFIPNLQLPVRLQKCPLCTIQNRKSYMRMRIF